MIRTVRIAQASHPYHLPENQHKKQEKYSRHLEHDDATHAAERAHKTAQATSHIGGYFSSLSSHIPLSCRSFQSLDGGRPGSPRVCSTARSRQLLPRQPSCHAKSDSQYPANSLRSHPVYDGSSEGHSATFRDCLSPAVAVPSLQH